MVTASTTDTSNTSNTTNTATSPPAAAPPPQAKVEDVLSAILESPHFTVADYLNTALYDVMEPNDPVDTHNNSNPNNNNENNNNNNNNNAAVVIHRLTELAVSLQLQTQNRHDAIHRTGMELQTLLPRCENDMQRLQTSYEQMLLEQVQHYHTDCRSVANTVAVATTSGTGAGTSTTTATTDSITPATAAVGATTTNNNNNSTDTTAADAAAAMETLGTLHALQTYLHRTKEILIALDVWDTTIHAISNYIVQENTTDAVQCLFSLEQSERVLAGMTEQREQRQMTRHKLQQQVTTLLLQPHLDHALTVLPQFPLYYNNNNNNQGSADTAPLQQSVAWYRALPQQLPTLLEQYRQQRSRPIHRLWFDTYRVTTVPTTINNNNTTTVSPPDTHVMVTWLPNFYQQVWQFLQEERRLCEQVFGVPSANMTTTTTTVMPTLLLIQILQECFRPNYNIPSSMTSRLHTIYQASSSSKNVTSSSISSFPIIATLYESTVQFLSLVYECIVSSYMDMVESSSSTTTTTTTNGTDAGQLYEQICTTFWSLVGPFQEYRGRHLATIEWQYAQVTMQPHLKAIQHLTKHYTKASNLTIEVLQETIDQLQSVATQHVFTLLESILQRYELLNGGYYLEDTIRMMDANILNQYMNELSIAVHTMSAYIVQNDSSQFIQIFEEAHVSIALQILLMLHELIQSVQQVEDDTRAMIQRWYDRLRNYHHQEERRNAVSASFQLSETLSMVEVNTILTQGATTTTHDSSREDSNDENHHTLPQTVAALQRYCTSSRTTEATLFTTVHETMQQKLLLSCHTFIFDVCYAVPRYHLSTMLSYKSWKADLSSVTAASVNHEYGTLPQEYMTHIGEHMLALVQALEPFAMNMEYLQRVNYNNRSDNSNSSSNILMNPKYIRRVVQPIWIDVLSAIGIHGNDTALPMLMNGTELVDYVVGDVVTLQHDDEIDANQHDDDDVDGDNHKAVTTFCNTWLDVVSTAVTGRLIERILRIPLLTNQGCEHIQADFAYIMNVLTALGIPGHPHPLLSHIATLATLDETVLNERRDAMASSSPGATETNLPMRLIQAMEQRFVAMRSFGS